MRKVYIPATPAGGIASTNATIVMMIRGILCAWLLAGVSAAQFKETAPAPYTPAVARQKIRTLIVNAGPQTAGSQTLDTLSGLLVWYRDVVDDELIAAWKGDSRANLPALITSLADARVASAIVDFSWREQRAATFTLANAPMLGDLMARYQGSAGPFLGDLLGGQAPDLPKAQADAVCRILLDMPDTGTWKKTALQILPRYRLSARDLLVQDLHANNQEKVYRAQFWLTDLKINVPGVTSDTQQARRPVPVPSRAANPTPSDTFSQRPHIVEQPSPAPSAALMPYGGPRSGTLKCSGDPVPPNAEYVFPGMPMGNIQLDLDGKPWAARLVPDRGQTQDLILTNMASRTQKGCTVRWSIIP
jgi:hypothetical protein